MKLPARLIIVTLILICAVAGGVIMATAQQRPQHDPLGFLKRAITEANAPALTTDQETQLTTLITNFHDAQHKGPDETLEAAHKAYNAAILAGDLAAAQAQVAIITSKGSELSSARMQALAKFQIDFLTVLKAGGQLDPLKQKFGDRLLGILGPFAGGRPFGGRPGGPGHPGGPGGFGGPGGHGPGPGFAPRFGPGRPGDGEQN